MKLMKHGPAALLLAGLTLSATAHGAVSYTLTDLGTLGGSHSEARGINANGQVVGVSDTSDGPAHAFLYSGGSLQDLSDLGGFNSDARSINATGQVVGESDTTSARTRFRLTG